MHDSSRAQISAYDVFFALILFVIVLVVLNSLWQSNYDAAVYNSLYNSMHMRASQALNVLVETGGNPADWETNPASAAVLGIAKESKVIDAKKLQAFANLAATDYEKAKGLLTGFDFSFELDGIVLGASAPNDAIVVSVERVVEYGGGNAIARLSVFTQR